MANTQQKAEATGVQEVARLVGKAREVGQADAFLGKRRWMRYQIGLRLEVTTGGSAPADTWPAVMHNISGGGFGFWSKRKLEKGDCIFIREWLETRSGEWLPAWVTHCTTGIQGHLVGARFEYACPPDELACDDDGVGGAFTADGGVHRGVLSVLDDGSLRITSVPTVEATAPAWVVRLEAGEDGACRTRIWGGHADVGEPVLDLLHHAPPKAEGDALGDG